MTSLVERLRAISADTEKAAKAISVMVEALEETKRKYPSSSSQYKAADAALKAAQS
jgi:hypothetical protein